MNANLFRLVFNAARGQVMAVSEIAASNSSSPANSKANRPLAPVDIAQAAIKTIVTPAAFAVALVCAGVSLTAHAQIKADTSAPGSQQAQILTTANGVTQVNIQTPSAAGVSRNVYSQFDVNAQGAILNNSRSNVQTQIGGWVQSNGNLAAGAARVILNEVNSSNPSQLKGFVEVAGQRAEVIIANPAGINVDGGGFINASGVTLTTGVAQINPSTGGSLDSFRVQGGNITFSGAGLDSSSADFTRVLARAVQANAGIWAKDLTVVTGANTINASTNAATPIATNGGAAPAFALDVAAIGGMYAGKITLVGTEAGLGVNNAGTIAASGGGLVLNVNGVLTNRGVLDGQTTLVKADTVNNTGTGRIYGSHVAVQAQTVNNTAETVNGTTSAAVIAARDRLDLGAATITNSEHAMLLSAGDMAIGASLDANNQATGIATSLRNGSATIESLGAMRIAAASITNANDHFAYSEQLINTQTGIREDISSTYYRIFDRYFYEPVVTQDDPGKIVASGNMVLQATTITNQQSKIVAGGSLDSGATGINNISVSDRQRIRDVGTQWTWGSDSGHSEGPWYDRHWVLDWRMIPSTYDVPTYTPVTVSQGVSVPNSTAAGANTTPARSTVAANTTSSSSVLNNALFNTATNPQASYLIETDPRFTNMRNWLGSDYMLRSLSLDPSVTQKRLGDGFYEQRLINEQVAQLTGRRFLANYSSDEQQYQALMDAGVTYAQAFNLRPGIALSAAQVAQLTSDIVWLVEKEVTLKDGSKTKALVPQVYAMVREGDLSNTGTLLSANTVNLTASADIANSGTILGRKVTLAANNITNTDGTIQGDALTLNAVNDIRNTRGTLAAQDSLTANAGNNITIESTVSHNGNRTTLDRQAVVYVAKPSGALQMNASGDINITASTINSAGTADIRAGGTIALNAQTTAESLHFGSSGEANFSQNVSQSTQTGSTISTGSNLSMQAGKNITATAVQIKSEGDVDLHAQGNIVLTAGQTTKSGDLAWQESHYGFLSRTNTDTRIQEGSSTAIVSSISGKNVTVTAEQNLVSVGTQFQANGAGNTLQVEGKQTQAFYEATNTQQYSKTVHSTTSLDLSGMGLSTLMPVLTLVGEDKTSTDASASSTAVASRLLSTQRINVKVGDKATLQGVELQANEINFQKSDPTKAGELVLSGSTNTTQVSHSEKTETAGVWQEVKGNGSVTQTLNQTQLKGNVNFDAALQITAQIPDTKGGQDLKTQINALASQPGQSYLADLANNPNVKWSQVALAHEKWNYSQAGLTPAGAAVVSIAVAYFTGGTGAGLVGATSATASATTIAVLNAGFTALASQASVAMLNNQGDIGKTLDQLGKEESIKSIAMAMVTAGALDKLNTATGIDKINVRSDFSQNLLKNVTNNVASSTMDAAINGKPLDEKTLSSALSNALITTGMNKGAFAIGEAATGQNGQAPQIDAFTQKLAHAVLGCAAGSATAGNQSGCAPGAVGAVVGEMASEFYNSDGKADPTKTVAFAKTMAAVAGVLVGGGGDNAQAVNIAATTGANAAENNYLTHVQEQQREKELAACKTFACTTSVRLKYAGTSIKQDAGLMIGVGGGIGYQSVEQAAAIVDLVRNLPETLTALSAIVTDPEFRAKVGAQVADEYKQRIEMQTRAYNDGGWDGSITAGVEAGRLAVDIVAVGTGAFGAGKVATKVASTGGTVIADAATTLALKSAVVFDSLDAAGQARWLTQTSSWRTATSELAQMELQSGKNSHPLLRHGDQVELAQLQQRALTGATPDGIAGRAVDSTRWLNNEDLLVAVKNAQARYAAGDFGTGSASRPSYEIAMGKTIGDGYYKNSTNYGTATKAIVALDTKGFPVTAFPKLP